jgi:hypothetical protein
MTNDLDLAWTALYKKASKLTPSRLSDYSLVKEQFSQTPVITKVTTFVWPSVEVLGSTGEADVIVCLAVVNPVSRISF